MFKLKNKSNVAVNAKTVHKVRRHSTNFHPSERNSSTNSPQKLFTVLPIALIIDIYNMMFYPQVCVLQKLSIAQQSRRS